MQTTVESLNTLQSRVAEIDEQTESTANEIKTKLDDFKSFTDEANSSIQEKAETTQSELSEIAQQAESFQTELTSQQESTTNSIDEFRNVIDAAKQSFETKAETLVSQLESFEQDVSGKLTALVADVDQVLEEGNSQLDSIQSVLDSTSTDVLSNVESLFGDQFLGELSGASQVLDQGVSLLKDTGVDRIEDFTGKFQDILGKVDDILDLIEEIKPVLELVNDYL